MAYIEREFSRAGIVAKCKIGIFLIGGAGLAFYRLKEATKDIDVILKSSKEVKELVEILRKLEYERVRRLSTVYKKMGTFEIMENADGFRWDIFHLQVCNALVLSQEMIARATPIFKEGNLSVFLASKEDIFLFKGITERSADLDDMRIIAESGLDWDVVFEECLYQSKSSGRLWENALYGNLVYLREIYGIRSPIEKKLRRRAETKLVQMNIVDAIRKGNTLLRRLQMR
ncbi:MAG: hypothetical protein JW815_02125 [Candidatus Bathyarchaeota archaeon]|nr:hypothetical protein [Candidatus Bathyarchaeum sp.]